MAQEREKTKERWWRRLRFKFEEWSQRYRIWIIGVLLLIGIVMGVVFERVLSKILPSEMATWGGVLLTFLIMGLWLRKCIRQVGTEKQPCQAVITRFAKPVDAVGLGLVTVFWPFENLKEFPTKQFKMDYEIKEGLYTKANPKLNSDKESSSLPVSLKATIYIQLPRVDRYYSVPMTEDKAKESYKEEKKGEITEKELEELTQELPGSKGLVWDRKLGKELLLTAYLRLPFEDLKKPEIDKDFTDFFRGAVEGAIRYAIGMRDTDTCKEKKSEIAEEIKNSLVIEEASPFRECGIPKECVDVELTELKFPDDIEKAWRALEVASREAKGNARAMEITGEGMKKALSGYEGVDKDVAAMLAKGKEPIVIKYKGGGGSGGLMDLGFQFEMGRQMAQKRFSAGRRPLEEEEPEIKKEEEEKKGYWPALEEARRKSEEKLKKLLEKKKKRRGWW